MFYEKKTFFHLVERVIFLLDNKLVTDYDCSELEIVGQSEEDREEDAGQRQCGARAEPSVTTTGF